MSDALAGVEIRPYRPGDEVAINDGFNRVFGCARSLEEWRWKFPAEPEGRWIMLATGADGTVHAHYGAVIARVRIGGVEVRAAQIVDAYSSPEARGSRLFTNCYEAFIAAWGNPTDLPLMYGFPGLRHYEMGLKRLEYVLLGAVPFWRRSLGRGLRWPLRGWSVRAGFDAAAVDELWRLAAPRLPVGVVRDAARLAARFTGRPGVDYLHLGAWRGGRLHAWAVALLGPGVLRWIDLIWDGEEEAALVVLDRALSRAARRLGLAEGELWLRGDAAAEAALERAGWRRAGHRDDLYLVARSFHPAVDLDALGRSVVLTWGDSDLV